MIRGVNVDADSVQGRLEGFLGARVKHLVANAGRVGVPCNENEFGSRATVYRLEIQVDESVAAVVVGKLLAKVLVGLGALSLLLNDNGFLVFDLVNVVAELFALLELERVERQRNLVVYDYASGLRECEKAIVV